jgi:hypothetical protein
MPTEGVLVEGTLMEAIRAQDLRIAANFNLRVFAQAAKCDIGDLEE